MAAEVQPPALAQLLDAAERPRVENWSLRAALTRYAQPQPTRASALIELVRRIESALRPFAKVLERRGEDLWALVESGAPPPEEDALLVEILRTLRELDAAADVLAAWAVERAGERPDAVVGDAVARVTARLEALGIAREERPRPTGRAGRG